MPRSSLVVAIAKLTCALALCGAAAGVSGYLAVRWALGGEELQVPDVAGLGVAEAADLLARHGLEAEVEATRLPDPQVPAEHVLRQEPAPGMPLKRRGRVRLTLSAGPPTVELPETAGDVLPRAEIALQQREIEVEAVARVHSDRVREDRVMAQEPQAAELAGGPPGAVRLLVSLGPRRPRYVMPDLIGRPLEEVRRFLEAHGFRIGQLRRWEGTSVPPGTVVGQQPAPGYPVAAGAVVDLEVSA